MQVDPRRRSRKFPRVVVRVRGMRTAAELDARMHECILLSMGLAHNIVDLLLNPQKMHNITMKLIRVYGRKQRTINSGKARITNVPLARSRGLRTAGR